MRFVIPKAANAKAANPANEGLGDSPPQAQSEAVPIANAKVANPAIYPEGLATLAGLALATQLNAKLQVLLTLAARAEFPEYRVNNHWVYIPAGKEAWHRNLQAMFKSYPKDLAQVLAFLEADLRYMQPYEEATLLEPGGDTHPKGSK